MNKRSRDRNRVGTKEAVPVTGGNHGRNTRRIILVSVIALSLAPVMAWTGGMAFTYSPTSPMEPLRMSEQRAIIAHKDGVQRMFISVNFEAPQAGEKFSRPGLWIFPVPGVPGRVAVDAVGAMPELVGEPITMELQYAMALAIAFNLASQPHLLALKNCDVGPWGGDSEDTLIKLRKALLGNNADEVIEIQAEHTEIVSANSVERLGRHLRGKNLAVDESRLQVFEPYCAREFVFVVSRFGPYENLIAKLPDFENKTVSRTLSLYVEFPSDEPFFPMRSTAGYCNDYISVSLKIMGFVSPDTSSWRVLNRPAVFPRVRYCKSDEEAVRRCAGGLSSKAEQKVDNDAEKDIQRLAAVLPEGSWLFTSVEMQTHAENFTQDFRFVPNPLAHIVHFVACSKLIQGMLFLGTLLGFSYLGAGVSGKVVFGEFKPWARIGLWNCLTVVAVVFKTWSVRRTQARDEGEVTVSGRWDAFVLGAFMCFSVLIPTFLGGVHLPSRLDSCGDVLYWVLALVELLIAAWIVTKDLYQAPPEARDAHEEKRSLASRLEWEACIRVFLVTAPALILLSFPASLAGIPAPAESHKTSAYRVICVLVVPLCLVLLVTALHALSWVAGKTGSPQRMNTAGDCQSAVPPRKGTAVVLGVLTCIVALLPISYLIEHASSLTENAYEVVRRVIVFFGMLITALVTQKGLSASIPLDSPSWPSRPMVFSGLTALVTSLVFLLITPVLLIFTRIFVPSVHHHTLEPQLLIALSVTGIAMIFGFPARKHVIRIFDEITYRTALSSALVFLGIAIYFTPLSQASFSQTSNDETLAVMALLLAAWVVKGELHERPTKTLRFAALFSVILTVLTLAALFGLYLLATSGWW